MAALKRIAVVLMNLGGPTSLEAVKPFLFNLFYDPAILRLPNPFRWLLAKIISESRASKAKKIYEKLGGKSPLLEETQKQAEALEDVLKRQGGIFKVFISMRYWHPFSQETIRDVFLFKPTDIVLLPLYPQFSTTTTQSSLDDFCKRGGADPRKRVHIIPHFFHLEGFLGVMAEGVRKSYENARKYGTPRILWTAHGLPKKIIDAGDPYQSQVEETVSLLEKKLEGMGNFESVVCYQSRVGPLKWIGPYTEDEIMRAGKDKAPLIIVPLSFVSEHSETLVELDMDYKELAEKSGVPFYGRVSTVRDHPLFIEGLGSMIREAL
jgi:ferrochelatase